MHQNVIDLLAAQRRIDTLDFDALTDAEQAAALNDFHLYDIEIVEYTLDDPTGRGRNVLTDMEVGLEDLDEWHYLEAWDGTLYGLAELYAYNFTDDVPGTVYRVTVWDRNRDRVSIWAHEAADQPEYRAAIQRAASVPAGEHTFAELLDLVAA